MSVIFYHFRRQQKINDIIDKRSIKFFEEFKINNSRSSHVVEVNDNNNFSFINYVLKPYTLIVFVCIDNLLSYCYFISVF